MKEYRAVKTIKLCGSQITTGRIISDFSTFPSYNKEILQELIKSPSFFEETEKLSYADKQHEWRTKNNIKVGDTVKITRKAENDENGWKQGWVGEMDKYVGWECKITIIHKNGFKISNPFDNIYDFNFPYFVLEKVEESSYVDKQHEWYVKNKIKVGDTVVVTRKAENNENGWNLAWVDMMDVFVDEKCEIEEIDEYGIEFSNSNFIFPYFVLEKVIEKWRAYKDEEIEEAWDFLKGKEIRSKNKIYKAIISEVNTFNYKIEKTSLNFLFEMYEVKINNEWEPIGKQSTTKTEEKCPYGHRFGCDASEKDECVDCKKWDACYDKEEELKRNQYNKGNKNEYRKNTPSKK